MFKPSCPPPAPPGSDALELLIIQPTPFCNMACDYCYLLDKDDKRRMSFEVLEATLHAVFDSRFAQGPFTIVWHAGEPMVVGVPYYEKAFELVHRIDGGRFRPKHSFQTNGTLVNDEWCRLIKAWPVDVGVSVDGPAFLHDAHRVTRSGGATYERVMSGVRKLQEHEIDFHVITVVTREALDHADELFEWYVENRIGRVAINLEESEGANATSSLSDDELRAKVKAFWARLLDLSLTRTPGITVREFAGLGNFILQGHGGMPDRSQESAPFRIINVDVEGNFSTFSPELVGVPTELYGGTFALGNVTKDSIESVLDSAHLQAMKDDITRGIDACRDSCAYFNVCGGGNASNKYFENGTFASSETSSCRMSIKALVDAMLDRFEGELQIAAEKTSSSSG